MPFNVLLTRGAERDLEDLCAYLAEHESRTRADHVLNQITTTAQSLATAPERGSCPHELAALGIHEYRQVFFKPYRVIYRIIGKQVFIYLIVDGRRDLKSLLVRRLLGA
jgi:toxin ParE1/3/4